MFLRVIYDYTYIIYIAIASCIITIIVLFLLYIDDYLYWMCIYINTCMCRCSDPAVAVTESVCVAPVSFLFYGVVFVSRKCDSYMQVDFESNARFRLQLPRLKLLKPFSNMWKPLFLNKSHWTLLISRHEKRSLNDLNLLLEIAHTLFSRLVLYAQYGFYDCRKCSCFLLFLNPRIKVLECWDGFVFVSFFHKLLCWATCLFLSFYDRFPCNSQSLKLFFLDVCFC